MKRVIKTISVILTVIMFFSVFSAANPVIAAEVQEISETETATQENNDVETTEPEKTEPENESTETEEAPETETAVSEPEIIGEDESRRDKTTKHFIMSDGSRRAIKYAQPVHYKENGKWVDIDNTLNYDKVNEEYTNGKNSFDVSFKKDFNSEQLLTIENKGYKLSWEYKGAALRGNFVKAEIENIEEPKNDFSKHVHKSKSIIKYDGFENKCKLEYVVTGTGVKENIILNSASGKNTFEFLINAPDLILVKNNDGSISAKANDDTEIFYIPAPFMFDSSNEYSDRVEYELTEKSNGKYTVKVIADRSWLNDENRVYPITIDPIIQTERIKSDITTTYVASGQPNTNFNEMQDVYIGVESSEALKCRALVKFELPTLNKGDMVVGGSLVLLQYASSFYHDDMPDQQIDACLIKDSWNASTVTWNTKPEYNEVVYDYAYLKKNESGWKYFDITRAVKGWYEGTIANNGIMIKKHVEDGSFSDVAARGIFYSDKYNGNADYFPYIAIEYRNNKGLESYWSYSSFSAGNTTANVNDYSGNLVYEIPLVSSVGEILPVSISLIYNGYAAGEHYVSGKSGSFLTTPGRGWKLNIQETVLPSQKYGLSEKEAEIYPYVYTDGDGTEHFFKKITRKNDDGEDETVYEDEDGLGLTLDDVATSTYTYKITDKQDNVWLFNAKGNLGVIKNAKGNKIVISYNDDKNKITKVTDGTGHTFTFGYYVSDNGTETNYLKTITDNAGRVTTINFTNCYIVSVSYFDNTSLSVHYENEGDNRENLYNETFEGLINYIKTSDGNGLNFNYNEKAKGRRVIEVTGLGTSGSTTVYGQVVTFDRSIYNTTIIRSAGIDGIHKDENSDNASDDIVTTLQFNNSGKPVSQQVSYGNGGEVGAGAYNYENNKAGSKNKITDAASLGKNTVNLLKNGNAESKNNWSGGQTDSLNGNNYLGAEQYTGKYSLYLYNSSVGTDGGNNYYRQVLSGTYNSGSTYTFSAFVKTENIVQKGSTGFRGAYIQISAFDSDGNNQKTVYSQVLTADTDININNGWRRLSTTIEVPSGTTITALKVYLCLRNATGKAYFDCMQLEKGSVPNSVNLLENSSFEEINSDGTPVGWLTLGDTDTTKDKTTTANAAQKNGIRNLIIHGEADESKTYYQKIPVQPNENDTYIVSGWSAAYAVSSAYHNHYEKNGETITDNAANEILDNTNKKDDEDIEVVEDTKYEIAVRVFYQKTDANGNSKEEKQYKDSAKFNPCVSRSQYSAIPVCLKYTDGEEGYTYTPTHIAVMLRYVNQANYAYFDHIQLVKDVAQSYVYDSEGNLVSVSANAEQKNNMTYDGENNLETYKDAIGSKTTFEYAQNTHQLTKVTSPKGVETLYNYNSAGQVTDVITDSSASSARIKTSTGYTAASGNITAGAYVAYTADENGYKTSSTYNMPTGALKTVTDAKGNVTTYSYDDTYSKIKSVTGKNTKVTYTYDGNRISRILFGGTEAAARSETYNFEYDAYGNIKSTKVGTRALSTNTYITNNGLLSHSTYGNGDGIKYGYDKSGNKTAEYKRDSVDEYGYATYRWSYSPNGIPRTHTDGANKLKYDYSYDSIGRLIRQDITKSTDNSAVGSTEFGYNSRGHKTSIINEYGGRTYAQYYKYSKLADADGNLIEGSLENGKEGLSTRYRALGVNTDYEYDGLNRLQKKTVNLETPLVTDYSYKTSARTEGTYYTNQLASELIGAAMYNYTYDKTGNITEIKKGTSEYRTYTYDELGQLKRENNTTAGTTTTYTYDVLGNINTKKEYDYTTGAVGALTKNITYTYTADTNAGWNNLLTTVKSVAYNNDGTVKETITKTIDYDRIGNPLSYCGATMTWYGRQMTSYQKGTVSATFTYDADGLRGTKEVNGVTTKYQYVGDKLFYEDKGNGIELYFFYDSFDDLTCIRYIKTAADGTLTVRDYYVATNSQGDVVSIFHDNGTLLARYDYDAWGNVVAIRNADGVRLTPTANPGHIAILNPIRYRGYYYDSETGFYLTGTRYYDPEIGRFINADGYVSTGQGVLGNNMFAYCGNNPVNRADPTGMFWKEIGDFFSKAWNGIKSWAKNTFGAGSSTTATIAEIETPVIPDPSPITVKTGTKTTQTISKHGDSSKPISVYANKDAQHPIKSSSAGININIVNFTLDLSVGLDDIGISGALTNGNTTNSFGVKLNLSELKIGFEGSTAIQWDNTTETAYTNASISGWAIAAAYILATTGQYVQSPSYAY